VDATLDLLIGGGVVCGTWAGYLGRSGTLRCQQEAGLDAKQIESSDSSLGLAAPRPAYSALSSERGVLLSDLEPGALLLPARS